MSKKLVDRATDLFIDRPQILLEAMPFIRDLRGCVIVIKIGEGAISDPMDFVTFAKDIVLLKTIGLHPVIVHGGGLVLEAYARKLGIKMEFAQNKMALTHHDQVEFIEMIMTGMINTQIVNAINSAGGKAVGLSGKDAQMIRAKKKYEILKLWESNVEKILDLGYMGAPTHINTQLLEHLNSSDFIPVITPLGFDRKGETYILNPDQAAGEVAIALKAKRLYILTDLSELTSINQRFTRKLKSTQIKAILSKDSLSHHLQNKLKVANRVVLHDIDGVGLLDNRESHAILLALFTKEGCGTLVVE